MSIKKRGNNEGNIRQRKDGRWEVRISSGIDFKNGKPKRVSILTKTKAEAIEALQKAIYDIRVNGYKDPANVTLEQWYRHWLETYMANSLKQSTYVSYEGFIRNHYGPALGGIKLKNLTGGILQEFYNYKIEDGLSSKTIRNMNLALHRCLKFAEKEGLILNNPTENINLPRQEEHEIEVLSIEQQEEVMRVSYAHRYGVFIRLTLCTGLRMGELLGLKWEDVDTRRNTINIRRTLSRLRNVYKDGTGKTEIVIGTPKSKNSRRQIPLPVNAMKELMQWKTIQQNDASLAGSAYQSEGFVVTNEIGKYLEPRTFKDYYNRILQDARVGHFTFHALRHTFATRAMERNMDAKTLSTLLGHFSVAFTLDTYAHCLDEQKRKGMDLMNDIYNVDGVLDKKNYNYPLIFTPLESGFIVTAPDFPKFNMKTDNVENGLKVAREKLSKILHGFKYPPIPTKNENLALLEGSFVVMMAA